MSAIPDNLLPMPAKVWDNPPKPSMREALWLREGKKCHWCGRPTRLNPVDSFGLPEWNAWDTATKDHVIPKYKGGSNDPTNLVSACRLCNNRRSHEDHCGYPEGALLGKFDPDKGMVPKRKKGAPVGGQRVALTADDKKAIMAGVYRSPGQFGKGTSTEQVLREQRDQAQSALLAERQKTASLKDELRLLTKEHAIWENVIREQKEILDKMTFRKLLVMKLLRWLKKENK